MKKFNLSVLASITLLVSSFSARRDRRCDWRLLRSRWCYLPSGQ
jgi:hypothetical protein